jgi:hypothetical protein
LASPWPDTQPTAAHRAAYADATPRSFWLDTLPERVLHPPLEEAIDADLCIVGGGYTGLWAALYAKELDPGRVTSRSWESTPSSSGPATWWWRSSHARSTTLSRRRS